ncbi:hypothetical protein J4E86_003657 [Alternaria arbusti]|uniref:uncharacterized protein n=1 Tax=Alternaria arbusti TaxID=232088 RepID=UPI00221E7890|nr:uncharacterized protein J4E86_003657 [Alternaria arbusti]KAI4958062.1 hypothetical protein J4E86_003657 [Alternaria arbusti]
MLTTPQNSSGSSTGSAVAVSAGFAPLSIGADFNGSLTNPATRAALYTIRTTPGIVSGRGCFPFSKNRDSVGPMAKCVADLVGLPNVIVDVEHPGVPERGYGTEVSREWGDVSFATLDPRRWCLAEGVQKPRPGALDEIIRETLAAYEKIESLAKRVVGPVDLITDETLDESMNDVLATIKNDFSNLFEAYTNGLDTPKVKTLKELIEFTEQHRKIELPEHSPNQDKLIQSLQAANSLTDAEYTRLDIKATASAADDAIDKTLHYHNVDVIIGPADSRLPDVVALANQHSVLFETPKNSVPYMKFWLKKVETEGIQEEWLALLAYDKESYLGMIPFGIFDLHMKSYTDIDDADPSSAKAPSKFFVELLHQYIRMYVAIVETERKGFMEAINKVEDSLNSDQRPSSLLRSLNTISRRIRAASLEIKLTFSKDAAEWAKDISASQFHAPITSEKPFLAQDIEQYHPDRLREVAAEVHQHIEDVIAERQQERQEKLQELEDVRRKEEWELLQQNLEIAKATQRDSRLMSGVAWVTMAFLPATFVSSFFGMNFFNGIAGDVPFDEASRSVWLFFVIAIPTSAFVLLTFYVWNEKQKKEDEHKRKLREKTTREDTASEDAAKRKTYEGTTVTSTGNDVEPPGLRQRM